MEDDTVHSLIGDLEEASRLPARRRQRSVKPAVEKLTSIAYEKGLLPDELDRLVELITVPGHLDQASLGALVRNLYPAAKVSSNAVLKTLGSLGNGLLKAPLAVQSLLLRWLIMVYHVLEDADVLSRAYAVLFSLIDTSAVRPQACQLLALVTRRKHVRPHRIQDILRISGQTSGDASLAGLLRVFKNYYPEIPLGDATRGRASPFKHPDPQWRERLDEIQQDRSSRRQHGSPEPRNGFAVSRQQGAERLVKGQRGLVVPTARTLDATENSVTLEEIRDAEVLVQNLEKIKFPSQLVAVLADPLLQKLMLLRPDDEAHLRMSNWLLACVADVTNGDADESLLLDMVEVIRDYIMHTRNFAPLFITFFKDFLGIWNGVDRRDAVLDTLTYLPLADLEELYREILQPLERAVLANTPDSQLRLLGFYRSLFCRWAVALRSSEDVSGLATASITNLINHINVLTLTLTQNSPTVSTSLAILDFYEALMPLFGGGGDGSGISYVPITIPPPLLIYLLHFSPSLVVVSRLCGLLAAYKRAWEAAARAPPAQRDAARARVRDVTLLNGFIVDVVSSVWRARAFATPASDPAAAAAAAAASSCLVPATVVAALRTYAGSTGVSAEGAHDGAAPPDERGEFALDPLFGLSHSPVFCLQAISSLRALEEAALLAGNDGDGDGDERDEQTLLARHPGPVTQRSLVRLRNRGGLDLSWHAYRAGVLKHLERKGFKGLPDLLYSTVKPLMEEKRRG